MENDDEIAYELDDGQIINACVLTYRENRNNPNVESIINRAAEYSKTVRGKKPKKKISLITPIGMLVLGKEYNEKVVGDTFVAVEEETFEEQMREWNYILGFFIVMDELKEHNLLISPYTAKEMKDILDNTVLLMRFIRNAREKR